MISTTKQGPVESLFIHLDQLWDEEGSLGMLGTLCNGDTAERLEELKQLFYGTSTKELRRHVSPSYKIGLTERLDGLIRDLSESRSNEKENAELRSAYDSGLKGLRCLRAEVLKLPYWQHLPRNMEQKEAQRIRRQYSFWGLLRVSLFALLAGGLGWGLIANGFNEAAVVLGLPIAFLALIGAWAFASGETYYGTLRNAYHRLIGSSSVKTYMQGNHPDQLEEASYQWAGTSESLDYDRRYRVVKRWSNDFRVGIGRDEIAWYACKDNFERFLELRKNVGSRQERRDLAKIMQAEQHMMLWGREPSAPACCCMPGGVCQGSCKSGKEEVSEEAEVRDMAMGAGLAAAAAYSTLSEESEPENEEEMEEESSYEPIPEPAEAVIEEDLPHEHEEDEATEFSFIEESESEVEAPMFVEAEEPTAQARTEMLDHEEEEEEEEEESEDEWEEDEWEEDEEDLQEMEASEEAAIQGVSEPLAHEEASPELSLEAEPSEEEESDEEESDEEESDEEESDEEESDEEESDEEESDEER